MKILTLRKSPKSYSCNSYLVLGDWNRIDDVNTVIDPGVDDFILQEIAQVSTGVGKVPVQQIILTHNHFDHCTGVPALKKRFGCRVFAYADGPFVDARLRDGEILRGGDGFLEVLHTPGHSTDSICVYAPSIHALFCGDTQLRVMAPGGSYDREYLEALKRLSELKVDRIYSGHEDPVLNGGQEMIAMTLEHVLKSEIC